MFAHQLDAARRLQPAQVERYGVDATELQGTQDRCAAWAADLRGEAAAPDTGHAAASRVRASYPAPATEAVTRPVAAPRSARTPLSRVAATRTGDLGR